jgi:hypothetical protein
LEHDVASLGDLVIGHRSLACAALSFLQRCGSVISGLSEIVATRDRRILAIAVL